ncbi:FtsH protease activity modulator HflK [Candidatus Omnitrophota bacterium]
MDFDKNPFGSFKPEDIINVGKKRLPDINKFLPVIVIVGILVIAALSSFYSIGPNEVGVVRRFGRHVRTTNPGLHFKLPLGIEKVDPVKVSFVFKEEFGFRTVKPGVVTHYSSKDYFEESLMLTGDLNVIIVEWIVQFKIKDPEKLLFNIRAPRETIRFISQAVMRQVVGDHSVSEVLTTRRVEINIAVQEQLQSILDSYDSGIQVVTVKLQDVNPPDPVKPSFNEVNEAKQEKEKVINQAWEAYNKAIPTARGTAEKTIKESEGYAVKRINKSKGDAAKFLATWNAYKDAKDVTRKRLYLETMKEIMPRAGTKYIIDPNQRGILPLLNLSAKEDIQ